MNLKQFKKYLRGKSVDKLLHHARKNSLSRILAGEKDFVVHGKKNRSPKRVTGTFR